MKNSSMGGIFGFMVGDALGVPVEFMDRSSLQQNPVTGMRAYGTHHQPKGTWSDDSTMMLCLMESMIEGLSYEGLSDKHVAWITEGYMTPHDKLFDIGGTTSKAIHRYMQGIPPLDCGGIQPYDNGNGSLMRILPVAIYARDWTVAQRMELTHQLSRLTHGHPRSQMACGFYVQLAVELMWMGPKEGAYRDAVRVCSEYYGENQQLPHFKRIFDKSLPKLREEDIKSSGYVVDTLEAAIWCFLTTDSYADCVLKAVNLGEDTDTVGAVAGGLAGLYYGYDEIPDDWVEGLVKMEELESLALCFVAGFYPRTPLGVLSQDPATF